MADNNSIVTLAEAFPLEQQRVRELIPIYESIGPTGAWAIAMMKAALSNAERAAASGDVIAMMRRVRGTERVQGMSQARRANHYRDHCMTKGNPQ